MAQLTDLFEADGGVGDITVTPRLRDRRAAPTAHPAARSVVGLQLIRVSDAHPTRLTSPTTASASSQSSLYHATPRRCIANHPTIVPASDPMLLRHFPGAGPKKRRGAPCGASRRGGMG
ncbi:MAG: hypothetical protein NC117_00805 [Pseudoflavonifractor sp.]|nr:hypothetical protein [Pseudoflavonifractor sp.]